MRLGSKLCVRTSAALLATALAVHAVLGCCWHHVHDCGRPHDLVAGDNGEHLGSPCHDPTHHNQNHLPNAPAHRDNCKKGQCVFLARVHFKAGPAFSSPCPPGALAVGVQPTRIGDLFAFRDSLFSAIRPPTPIYLAHQVLLI